MRPYGYFPEWARKEIEVACHIVILGASYGSLLSTKLLMAGHDVTLVCLPEEAELINTAGTIVRITLRSEANRA